MAEQIAHTKNEKIEQFGRICFYAGLLLELLIVILDKSSWINPLEGQMFRVSFLLFACKLCVAKYSKKEWLAVLAAGVIAGLCYLGSDRDEAVRAVVFVASMKGIDHKKALRVVFYVTLTGMAVLAMLSLAGVLGEVWDAGAGYGKMRRRHDAAGHGQPGRGLFAGGGLVPCRAAGGFVLVSATAMRLRL